MLKRTLLVAAISVPMFMGASADANVISFDFGRELVESEGGNPQASNALQGIGSIPVTEPWGDVGADNFSNASQLTVVHEGVTLLLGDVGGWAGASRDRGGTNSLRQIGSVDPGPQAAMFDVLRDFAWESGGSDDGWLEMRLSGLTPDTSYTLRAWFFEATNVQGNSSQREAMTIYDNVNGNALGTVNQNYANPDMSYVDVVMTSDNQGHLFLVANDTVGSTNNGGRLNGLQIIPEPTALSLLGVGMIGMLQRRRGH